MEEPDGQVWIANAAKVVYDVYMNRNGFVVEKIASPLQWLRVYCLYRKAFPRDERKPFGIIVSMARRGKTDVWYCEKGGHFAGFASTINGDDLILLDYMAVGKRMRGRGIGSAMLRKLQEQYAGKGLFVEIESAYEAAVNQVERMRRKRFYLHCGMQPSKVMASVFGVNMELLCWNCSVDFARYHSFYNDHYNPWAAEHIVEAQYPEGAGE